MIRRRRSQAPRATDRANRGRVAAARALVAVERGEHAEDALERLAPDGRDRGLSWHLVLGVLRRRGVVDAALRPVCSQPLTGLDPEVRAALRMGAFELLFARTPRHAAVNEAVEVVAAVGLGRARGLVNAVLRRMQAPTDLKRSERLNHPAWLVSRWTARYGEPATDAWCESNNEPPPLTVVVRDEAVLPAWSSAGIEAKPARIGQMDVPNAFTLDGVRGSIPEMPGFGSGAFWVQDAAAIHVADVLLGAVEPTGCRVLDACAAPGGKTFRLLAAGAVVTAADRDAERLEPLRRSAERLALMPEAIVAHDWETGPSPQLGVFDAVLVDAPCTALGTVRRHPDVRWRRQPADLPANAVRQRKVIEGVLPHLRPGGVLVYAVCSPEPEEGDEVVAALLADHPELALEASWSSAPPASGEDAFQVALLRRA